MKNYSSKFKNFYFYAAVLIFAVFVFNLLPILASAYTLLQPLPGGDQILQKDVALPQYLGWIFRFVLAAAAFLAVVKIVIGGMHIMVGGASESSQTKGREMISMAIWGLLLAISSVLILGAINPDLVKTGLTVPDIKVKSGSGGDGIIMDVGGSGCCIRAGWSSTECEYVKSSADCKNGSFENLKACGNFSVCENQEKKCPDGFVWTKSVSEKEGSCVDLREKEPAETMTCFGKGKFKDKKIECDKRRYNKCGYYYTDTPKCEYEGGL